MTYANQAPPRSLSTQSLLTRQAWGVLAIVTIFWIADGYDTFVLLVTARPTLTELLARTNLAVPISPVLTAAQAGEVVEAAAGVLAPA